MRLYGKEFLIVWDHPVRFDGHSHCGSEDLTFLIDHVSSRDHLFKRLCDFMGGSFSKYLTILLSLLVISFMIVEINRSNTPRDLEKTRDQRALWLYGRNLLIVYPYPATLGSHWLCDSGYIMILACHRITWYTWS